METLSEHLHIEGIDWIYVKTRALDHGNIYIAGDGSRYLRAGPVDKIQDELGFARNVHELGYPTPEVLSEGEIDGQMAYFTETSLGSQTFGDIFNGQYIESSSVNDDSFNQYCHIANLFLIAQIKSAHAVTEPSNLREGVNLDNVIEENPDLNRQKLELAFSQALAKVNSLPLVLTHGDLGPFNMMPGGVIDFEHKFIAPAGFDVITSPFIGRFWNFTTPDGVNRLAYDFSETQIQQYLAVIDAAAKHLGLDNISQHTDDMLMLKAIWGTSYEKQIAEKIGHPHIWQNKKETLRYCIDQYVAGQPIDSSTFGKHI
jgi:hypothetical protein